MSNNIQMPKNRNNVYTPSMKTIKQYQKKAVIEMVKYYLKAPWVFDKNHEKILLWVMGLLALWKIGGFFF